MEIGIIGTSIWQHNLPLLQRLTLDRDNRNDELSRLKQYLGAQELFYVATCNRVELMYVRDEQASLNGSMLHRVLDFFFADGRDVSFFPNDFYHYTGKDAIRHLFRTVSSLESLVVGETQVTGQFADALAACKEAQLSGPVLEAVTKQALQVAKRVRRETEIGQGAVSMASLAVSTIRRQLPSNARPRIALVGAGPMTAKCAGHLHKGMPCDLVFVNRTPAKVRAVAEQFEGEVVSLDEFRRDPGRIDAIISATAAGGAVFDCKFATLLAQQERPVVCVDLAIPADFCEAFGETENIMYVDIAKLRACGQQNLRNRFVTITRANDIVQEEVEQYFAHQIEVTLKPIFHQSYNESVAMARRAFDDLFDKKVTSLGQEDREAILHLVNKLLGRSCFGPAKALSDQLATQSEQLLSDDIIGTTRESA